MCIFEILEVKNQNYNPRETYFRNVQVSSVVQFSYNFLHQRIFDEFSNIYLFRAKIVGGDVTKLVI